MADKSNTIVILNKNDYVSRLTRILDDTSKFKGFTAKEGKVLNHIFHLGQHIIDLLKCSIIQN